VLAELRKGPRRDKGVDAWIRGTEPSRLYTSVLVVGEIRRGVERIRRRDPNAAASLEAWLTDVERGFGDRILPITRDIAERWGHLGVPDPMPVVDGLLAATALVHGLTLITRNTKDVLRTGVVLLNPFEGAAESKAGDPEQG
jgi:hypothetical protein